MDRLDEMFEHQLKFQQRFGEFPPPDPKQLMAAITTQAYALTDEIHEATGEVGWKPWASSNHVNRAAYLGELVDAWHFFMNLCLLVNITPEELYAGYMDKIQVNHKRQDDGYDGVSGKCPGCRRAYDDKAVSCWPGSIPINGPDAIAAWCEQALVIAYTGHPTGTRGSFVTSDGSSIPEQRVITIPLRGCNESIESWTDRVKALDIKWPWSE